MMKVIKDILKNKYYLNFELNNNYYSDKEFVQILILFSTLWESIDKINLNNELVLNIFKTAKYTVDSYDLSKIEHPWLKDKEPILINEYSLICHERNFSLCYAILVLKMKYGNLIKDNITKYFTIFAKYLWQRLNNEFLKYWQAYELADAFAYNYPKMDIFKRYDDYMNWKIFDKLDEINNFK